MRILITGVAGFIGMQVAHRLLGLGYPVWGVDNLYPYYSLHLKRRRLALLSTNSNFHFREGDLAQSATLPNLFQEVPFTHLIHLAAQAGVRYSLDNPLAYTNSNLVGFSHILEAGRQHGVKHLIYASSSSVYGLNHRVPFAEANGVDHPASFYAATKRANELMAHSYSHLFGLPCTGLRFFTVYGPWGRPDMAYYDFTRAILAGEPLRLFNNGQMERDFTYIDDIVEGVVRLLTHYPTPDPEFDPSNPVPHRSSAPWRLYNIGNHQPVALEQFVSLLETLLGRTVERIHSPMQAGDVKRTWALSNDLFAAVGYHPQTPLETGLSCFVSWYRGFHGV